MVNILNDYKMLRVMPDHHHVFMGEIQQYQMVRQGAFSERRKWKIKLTADGRDQDKFDWGGSTYLLLCHKDNVIGGVRLRNSMEPNLTLTEFSREFKLDPKTITHPAVMESSRFCKMRHHRLKGENKTDDILAIWLASALFQHAEDMGAQSVVTVVDQPINDLFARWGWPLQALVEKKYIDEADRWGTIIGRWELDPKYYATMLAKLPSSLHQRIITDVKRLCA
ncbi:acyl-homoserine-lactone synthase [Candidatus Odyssella thessalonicensis]|uniref:acyl-homoserine-lactone synthase n=1 Tax=Candidatus Odyssella thessalonicensis TaxID=84647 RepID=UPI000225B479|nr:acyl-homoserine-lactone synthase [Candidatus Odyssella thessalonicensis]